MSPTQQQVHDEFQSKPSEALRQRRMSSFTQKKKPNVQYFQNLTPMWAGISGQVLDNGKTLEIGKLTPSDFTATKIAYPICKAIAIHDSVYSTDFSSFAVPFQATDPDSQSEEIEEHVVG
jgi:alpha,alpha-trehalose phosphorylase (configuration-retaining)